MYPPSISSTRIGGIHNFLRVVKMRLKQQEKHTFIGPLDKCGLSGGKIFYCANKDFEYLTVAPEINWPGSYARLPASPSVNLK